MLSLTCYSTGSEKGNCYALKKDNESLLLDCGISRKRLLEMGFSGAAGCCVTHHHRDHSLCRHDLEFLYGIPVFAPYDSETDRQEKRFGAFGVQAFAIKSKNGKWLHTNGDGSECPIFGFKITVDNHSLVYATDMLALPYTFQRNPINTFLIACNHEDDMEYDDAAKERHSILGHSSLSTVKEIIRVNRTPALKNVILCHLTWAADRAKMLKEITSVVDDKVNVCIAEAGMTYLL